MTNSPRRIRVLHITGMDSTKMGSVEKWFLGMAAAFPDIEHILVYNTLPQSKTYLKELKRMGIGLEVTPCVGRAVVSNLPGLWNIVQKHKPDVVHFHFGYSCLTLGTFLRVSGYHTVKTQHSCLINKKSEQMNRLSDFSLKHRVATADGLLYKAMERVTFVGRYVEKQYTAVYGPSRRYRYLPLGIAHPQPIPTARITEVRSHLNIPSDGIMVLSTLFAVPMKGPDIFIEAARYISNPKVTMVMVGIDPRQPFEKELRRLIAENGLEQRVKMVGLTDKVAEYVAAADIYVQPSRTEALPLAVVEAMGASKPVIGSNVGGLPELALRLFEVGDAKGLAAHIDELAADPEARAAEGAREYETFRENYLLDNTLPRMAALYREFAAE